MKVSALAVDRWTVTFSTARRRLRVPSLRYLMWHSKGLIPVAIASRITALVMGLYCACDKTRRRQWR